MTEKKTIKIRNRTISMGGCCRGGVERYSVAMTNPLVGYKNLTRDDANHHYRRFIELAKKVTPEERDAFITRNGLNRYSSARDVWVSIKQEGADDLLAEAAFRKLGIIIKRNR